MTHPSAISIWQYILRAPKEIISSGEEKCFKLLMMETMCRAIKLQKHRHFLQNGGSLYQPHD